MAIKFKITPGRIAEVCNITEYLLISNGHRDTIIRVLPRFIVENDAYIVNVKVDGEGDIEAFENINAAFGKLAAVTPKRLDKLAGEFAEAGKNIVNPPNAEA